MGNHILAIVKKEFDRFFRDKRLVFTTIIMPALLIYALYSVMGAGISSSETPKDDHTTVCIAENVPTSFEPIFASLGFELASPDEQTDPKKSVETKTADLYVIFPQNFDEQIAQGTGVPQIKVYYNSTANESYAAYSAFMTMADAYENSLSNIMDINTGDEQYDLATANDKTSSVVASMFPMLIISLLFTGCVSVAPESIAGEKERGTIATLLVTPVSRSAIAAGKIISLSFFALLSGISSFIGIMLSLPKMLESGGAGFDMNVYGIAEYACVLAVIITTVLVIVAMISVVSAYSKSVKEATTMATPLMMLSVLAGLIPMFAVDFGSPLWRLIPLFNSIISLGDIFAFEYSIVNIAITCVANLVYLTALSVMLSKMFNSEKIMFKS